jgi:ssDNA thymidine ADP-ribosyltransferase, DarT
VSHRVTELHCIMPIENIPSVIRHGILSHEQASRLEHDDISLSDVQDKRDRKTVPSRLKLHQYANLYFCARNPMMYKRRNHKGNLCVLRISKEVLKLQNVVLAVQNAASKYVSFYKSPQGLHSINFDMVFADNWKHPEDQIAEWRHSSAKCAEVLVPHCVEFCYIIGAYVANETAKVNLENTGFDKSITINAEMFFA